LDDDLELKRELVKILDDLITRGTWTGSLFLESSGKKLRDLREELYTGFRLGEQTNAGASTNAPGASLQKAGFIEVFVALYQADGLNVTKWSNLLSAISSNSIGRPVYGNEDDIKAWFRTKENKQNDAYAVVYIHPDDKNKPAGKPLLDRYGHELLTIREGAIKSKNITRFVHVTGQYTFLNGVLTKQAASEL
jgi:intracellular multiplication protein IcmQ